MKPRTQDGPSPLERALEILDIPQVWAMLGLPGTPSKSCRSPFREERHPSFSVYDNGKRAKDFATGQDFDVLDFICAALDCDKSTGSRWAIEKANTAPVKPVNVAVKAPRRAPKAPQTPKAPVTLPALQAPSYGEIRTLCSLRRLPFLAGAEILVSRKMLLMADLPEGRAWILTDNARMNAQARLLSGEPLPVGGRFTKAKTLPGSQAAWPCGIEDAKEREIVLLCEGGPDAVALATVLFWERTENARDFGICAMLGASLGVHPDALPLFRGKRVRIFAHRDEARDNAGFRAAGRWAKQLREAGALHVDIWHSDAQDEDLNNYVTRTWTAPDEDEPGGWPETLTPESKTPDAQTSGAKS